MMINSKFFSYPPFISTSWNHVTSLHTNSNTLIVTLKDGRVVEIPGLKPEEIENIFNAHAIHLEHEAEMEKFKRQGKDSSEPVFNRMEIPFRIDMTTLDSLGTVLQHNPAQANILELPQEVLNKIGAIAKIVTPEEGVALPKPEPHCNCVHCQVARAIQKALGNEEEPSETEPEITEEDLHFQQWIIKQTGENLFDVTNKLDSNETYHVYLGNPVGCTCGNPGCEHILAVLKS